MNKTATHISHLLTVAPRLAVPGLGCFVVSWRPAQYQEVTHRYLPPLRVVEILEGDCEGDGKMLINSLCVREYLSPEQARELVNQDVRSIMDSIKEKGEYFIDGVGTLIMEDEAVRLVQTTGILNEYAPVVEVTPQVSEEKKVEIVPEKTSGTIAIRAAASTAAAIVGFGIVALLTMFFNRMFTPETPHMASMGNVPTAREVLVQEHATVSSPLVLIVNTPADGAQEVEQPRKTLTSQEDNYFLIVASLASAAEADNYASTHSTAQIPLTVLSIDGRFRIAAASGDSYQAVDSMARANDIFNSYPSAWICRR